MNWFKHFTNWYRDPDVCDGYKVFSHLSYVFFQCLREAYAELYDLRDNVGFIRTSLVNISRRCHTKPDNILRLFSFFSERNRVKYRVEGDFIYFQILDFEKLIGNWRQRKNSSGVATVLHGDEDEEEKREERKKEDSPERVAREILEYFNLKTGKCLNNASLILNLLQEGRGKEDFFRIIDLKAADPFFQKNRRLYNLRTLFAGDRFDTYLAEYHDSRSEAPAPACSAPASAPEHDVWKLKAAYYRFLKQEFPSLQDGLNMVLSRHRELPEYLARHGLEGRLDHIAVQSCAPERLVLFPYTGYTVPVARFFEFFTSITGVAVEIMLDVPEDFIASGFIPGSGQNRDISFHS
jgi:uncharacterized phage protein (TIGR02220 family)